MKESNIEYWHGEDNILAYVSHDCDTGNAATTEIKVKFEQETEYLINITVFGSLERAGLAEVFRMITNELESSESKNYSYGVYDEAE